MNINLLEKFIECQAIIVQPITPHISEYVWFNLLKKTEKMKWPQTKKTNFKILSAYNYFQNTIHNFRAKIVKETKQKLKKPHSAIIHYSKNYTKQQLQVIKIINESVKSNENTFSNKIISVKMLSSFDKKETTDFMPFVNYLGGEYEKFGFEALGDTLFFDEYQTLKKNEEILKSHLSVDNIEFYEITESNIKDPNNRACLVSVSRPQITFIRDN